eukprot:s3_g31.t2
MIGLRLCRCAPFRCGISTLARTKLLIQSPCGRRRFVLPASQFQHILDDVGWTSLPYAGDPLALTSPSRRGKLLEALVRDVLGQTPPADRDADASSGECCINGRRKGRNQARWDFIAKGRKVEVKASQLSFDVHRSTWRVSFNSVKLARDGYRDFQPFDDLYLVIYSPSGFYILLHDQQTGVSTAGVRTQIKGHDIVVGGSRNETWTDALSTILDKMLQKGHCKLISQVTMREPRAQALYARLSQESTAAFENVYCDIPLGRMNPVIRGHRIQQIGLEIDRLRNPSARFAIPTDEMAESGVRRGRHNASVDWVRDDVKVELKHAKVRYHQRDRWLVDFSGIKAGMADRQRTQHFDELWLAMYSPCDLHFLKHPPCYDFLSSAGLRTEVDGQQLAVYGSRGAHVSDAVENMKLKLYARGCTSLATAGEVRVWLLERMRNAHNDDSEKDVVDQARRPTTGHRSAEGSVSSKCSDAEFLDSGERAFLKLWFKCPTSHLLEDKRILLQNAGVLLSQVDGKTWVSFPDNQGELKELSSQQLSKLRPFLGDVAEDSRALPELPIALRHGSHGNAGLMVCSVQRLYKELKKQEAQLLSDESAGSEQFDCLELTKVPWADGITARELIACCSPDEELQFSTRRRWLEVVIRVLPSKYMIKSRVRELLNYYYLQGLTPQAASRFLARKAPLQRQQPGAQHFAGPGSAVALRLASERNSEMAPEVAAAVVGIAAALAAGNGPIWPLVRLFVAVLLQGQVKNFLGMIVLIARLRVVLCLARCNDVFGYLFYPFVFLAQKVLGWNEGSWLLG